MLNKKIRGLICSTVTSMMVLSPMIVLADELNSDILPDEITDDVSEEELTNDTLKVNGTYDIVVEGFDWGPGVTKVIITLDKKVKNVTKDMFSVKENKVWYSGLQEFNRNIVDAYISDEKGNKTEEESSSNITIILAVNPDEGNPFLYNFQTGRNNWAENYELKISLTENAQLEVGEETTTELSIDSKYVKKEMPTIDKFKESVYSAEGDISMSYAYYEPEEDNVKNPLIIWLHGAGEGGTDTAIDLLGNRVGALIEDNIQDQFGGAYVLTPQSPTMWMDTTGNGDYTTDGSNIYLESLMNLIKSYVDSNNDIDLNRIYVGGCSNGGYMTMALVLEHPEYFAAAYPICEAFNDSWISDEKLNGIKDVPMWFTYASNDETVNPTTNSMATVARLLSIGAKDIKVSEFDNVIDTSGLYKDENGNPYEYNGHWSWIYAFNDECKDGDESLWSWLAKQEKTTVSDEPVDDPVDEPIKDPVKDPVDDPAKDPVDDPTDEPIKEPTKDDGNKKPTNTIKPGNTSQTSNKGNGKLPNTGAPISSVGLSMLGAISTIAGIKLKGKKK